MIFYKLDYVIEKVIRDATSKEQNFIKHLTGEILEKTEARNVFEKINDHKWYLSERLGRDVGSRVAAVDFIENIYKSNLQTNKRGNSFSRDLRRKFLTA